MPYHESADTDPLEMNAVAFAATPENALDAAYSYAEELSRDGQSREAIILLFQMPFYQGPFEAFKMLGKERITEIVDECCAAMDACRGALRQKTLGAGIVQGE